MLYENGRRVAESVFQARHPDFDYTTCKTIKQRLHEMATTSAKLRQKADVIQACKASVENVQQCERVVEQVKQRLVETTNAYEERLKKISMSVRKETPHIVREECVNLKKQLESVQKELNNARQAIKNLEDARASVNTDRSTERNDLVNLSEKNKELISQTNELSDSNKSLSLKNQKLEDALSKKENALTQLSESKFTANPLFQPQQGLSDTNQALQQKLDNIQAELNEKNKALSDIQQNPNDNKNAELFELTEKNATLSTRVAELDSVLNNQSAELAAFIQKTNTEISRLTTENSGYRSDLTTKEAKLKETEEILTSIRTSLEEAGLDAKPNVQEMINQLVTRYKLLQEAFAISENQLRALQENPDVRLERAKALATKWLQRLRSEYTSYIKALPKEADKVALDMKKTNWQARKEFEQIDSLISGAAIDLSNVEYGEEFEKPEVETAIINLFKEKLGICINQSAENKNTSTFINLVYSRLDEAKREIIREWQGVIERSYITNMSEMVDALRNEIATAFSTGNTRQIAWKNYNEASWTTISDAVLTFFNKINEFDFLSLFQDNSGVGWITNNFPKVTEHPERGVFRSSVVIDSIQPAQMEERQVEEKRQGENNSVDEERKDEETKSKKQTDLLSLVEDSSSDEEEFLDAEEPVEETPDQKEKREFEEALSKSKDDTDKGTQYIDNLYENLGRFRESSIAAIKEASVNLFKKVKTAIMVKNNRQEYYRNLDNSQWEQIIEEIKGILTSLSKDLNSKIDITVIRNKKPDSNEPYPFTFAARRPTKASRKRRSIRKRR